MGDTEGSLPRKGRYPVEERTVLRCILTMLCVLVVGFRPCLADLPQSTSTGLPVAHVCASVILVPPDDFRGAFAYEFRSPEIVAFLSDLKHVSSAAQHAIFLNAVAAASTPEQHSLEAVESMACPNLDEAYGRIRGLVFVTNLWHQREIRDPDKFAKFASVMSDTISALSIGDSLTSEQRRLALAPLADPVHAAAPSPKILPSNDTSVPCKKPQVPERRLETSAVTSSAAAARAGTHGLVEIHIDISETGEILSAREISDEFNNGPGSEDMVRSAIFVAATAVFSPKIEDCKPVRSDYVFRAYFS